ncbi:MAG TPA: ATP-binding cassette domain-containing protein [Burkholderiales bacterium]|nr:ATP-binding cassette domain-containing protein [Burkholderiales bacterium]
MIRLSNLTLARAGRVLLEDVDLTLHAGRRVGVVGPNGCGKTSLFALLAGELHPEVGDLDLPPRLTIARVAQETPAVERPAIEYAMDGDAGLRGVEAELARAESAHDGHRLAELHAQLEGMDGYSARARAAALLHGLGFADADLVRPVAEFSGGWRMRLNLAQALMCRSDLLLLDEPTNHLDLDAVLWLEEWLRSYPGTLLLISHDRDFLDAVVESILSIEERRLRLYAGTYSDFERARAEILAQQQAAYARQQRELARVQHFIDRFRAKATKARQAQSRLKALARMELIAAAHVDSPFDFAFRTPEANPDRLLALEEAAVGYGDAPVLSGIELALESGARVGLLGRNGAGKSTLVKLLAGELTVARGERLEGKGLKIGYFAQHQLEQLRGEEGPLRHLQRLDPATREQDHRDFLGGFNFRGGRVDEPVGNFSGGEKARLVLAMLVWQRPNLLLLDEPTNHLDLEMRHALTEALQDYEGALVVVSHDRHLLRTTVERLLLVAEGRVQPFDGDLDDYRAWLAKSRATEPGGAESGAAEPTRKDQRRMEAESRNRANAMRRPLRSRIEVLEKRMAELNREKARLDALFSSGDAYSEANREQLLAATRRQGEIGVELEAAEEDWLAAQDELEKLEASMAQGG